LNLTDRNRLREGLASLQHEIWSHWMRYMFSVCPENADGSLTIPRDKAERWKRQSSTPYDSLPQSEKETDREQADKILGFLEK
jgi:hypothetical protein